MKRPSDHLFLLIQSMNQSEKRYFKRFAQQHLIGKKNHYVKLFDLIKGQEVYDEAKLLKSIKDRSLIKNFAEHKRYLYQQILKALRNYKSTNSVFLQLQEALMNIYILYERKMYDSALGLIKKALKDAEKYELFEIVFMLKTYELKIAGDRDDLKYVEHYINEGYNEEVKILQLMSSRFMHVRRECRLFRDVFKNGKLEDNETYTINLEDYPINSFRTALTYYSAEDTRSIIFNDNQQKYYNAKQAYLLFTEQSYFIKFYWRSYIIRARTYIGCCSLVGKMEEGEYVVNAVIANIEDLYGQKEIEKVIYYEKTNLICSAGIYLNIHSGNIEQLKSNYFFIKENSALKELKESYNHYTYVLYSKVIAELVLGLNDDAMETIHEFNSYKQRGVLIVIDGIMRMLSILVNYEGKNFVVLPNLVDSTYLFLRSKDLLGDFEKLFFSFFRTKILRGFVPTKKETQKYFHAFKAELQELQTPTSFYSTAKSFNFNLWIESKIQNKPMVDLLLEQQDTEEK